MHKNIKVAFILPSFAGGGAERVVLNLCNILCKSGVDPVLIILSNSGNFKNIVGKYEVVYINKSKLRWAIFPLIQKLKQIDPDVIFSTFSYITLTLLALRKYFPAGNNIIARESNMLEPSFQHGKYKFILDIMHKKYISKASKIIASSMVMYKDLISRGIDSKKLTILHNPVDVDNIRDIPKTFRKKGKGLRLVAAGRLVYQKGFDRLIPIVGRLNKASNLIIFGDGPERVSLEKIIINLNLSKQVQLKPFSNQLWSYMAGADAFLLSSRWEGMPNVALESLSLGTPVISFNFPGGLSDLVDSTIEGSVKICNTEIEMLEVLRNLLPKDNRNILKLRKSLLPRKYMNKNVARHLKEIIYGVNYKK